MNRPKRSNDVRFGLFQSNEVHFWRFDSNDVRFRLSSTLSNIVGFFSTLLDFFRLYRPLFDYTGHCSTLPDIVRLYSTLFHSIGNFSILPGVSQSVLNYNETRTSFDRFCQIMCEKPQPGQPKNIIEKAKNLSIIDSYGPDWVVGRYNQPDQKRLCFDRFV